MAMLRPIRPAAYVRVLGARSTADPHIREQARAVVDAARDLGWPRPTMYLDIGLPGTHRPGTALSRLAGYLASGRHDAIIVRDLSRISRDPAEVLAFAVACIRCGVIIETIDEGRIDESRLAELGRAAVPHAGPRPGGPARHNRGTGLRNYL